MDEALSLPPPERARWLDKLVDERASHREALRALLPRQALVETDGLGQFVACLHICALSN